MVEEKKLEVLMQSKNLVETSYNVTAIQNRVFYYCLFAAQKEKSGELSCTVKLENIKKLIPNPNQCTLANVKKIFKVFKETSLLFDKEDDGDVIECDYNLIAGSEYNKTKQEFKIFFMERLYNHILAYSNYAPLNLEIMTRFTSFYSQRLYEALRMWSRTGKVVKHIFKIETLRFILGVGNKYPEYKNLKQRVLTQALKEINEMGNMEVTIREIKEGKRITKLEFTILDNEPKKYFKEEIIESTKADKDNSKEALTDESLFDTPTVTPEKYVNYPNIDFLSSKIRKTFIVWCFENGNSFDESFTRIFNESKDIFISKKDVDKISKVSDYKYFLGILKNRLEDDIRAFSNMINLELKGGNAS